MGLSLVTFVGTALYSSRPKTRIIAGQTALGPQGLELHPAPPLRSEMTRQWVGLDFATAQTAFDAAGAIRTPKGTARVEVEVEDQAGHRFALAPISQTGTEVAFSVPLERLPPARPPKYRLPPGFYGAVRLRSDQAIDVRSITWHVSSAE